MSILKRLKSLLTGVKEESTEEKKSEPPETKVAETSPETEKKMAEEKVEESKSTEKSEAEVSKEPTEEVLKEKPTQEVTEESELVKEAESVQETEEVEEKPEPQAEAEKEKPKEERSEKMTLLNREENLLKGDVINKEFSQQVKEAGGDSLEYCFQCGTCTGSCPSGRRTPYRVRQLIRKANMGLKDELLADPEIWMCSTCYACQERCPRKVKIVDVVKLVRNHAAQAGYMGPAHKMVGSFVIKTGHGVPINDATMELRKQVGLDELPPTTHQFPGALEEIQKITAATGFDSLIGYNPETGELE